MTEPARTCVTCRFSVELGGGAYAGGDRAYCTHPDLTQQGQTGEASCESMRFDPHNACGPDGNLWEPRA